MSGHFTPGHLTPILKVASIDAYNNMHDEQLDTIDSTINKIKRK